MLGWSRKWSIKGTKYSVLKDASLGNLVSIYSTTTKKQEILDFGSF